MSGLFAYQVEALAKVEAQLARGMRPLCVMPTGAGKGTLAAHMLNQQARQGRRALLVVHRREIVEDLAERTRSLFPRVGVILPGKPRDAGAPIQVASTQSLLGSTLRKYDLLVADECHHYGAETWRDIVEQHQGPLVGFTATPERGDGLPLADIFNTLVVGASYRELIRAGRIVDCDVLSPERHLGQDRAQCPVAAYLTHARGQAAFVFVDSVARAKEIRADFDRRGVRVECIHEKTARGLRAQTLERLDAGALDVIVNVYTMGEGVDAPRVSAIVLDRSAATRGCYVQMTGRALRAYPGKKRALLLDLHGAAHLHGSPTEDREYSLLGSLPLGSEGPVAPVHGESQAGQTLNVELAQYTHAAVEVPRQVQVPVPAKAAPLNRRQLWKRLTEEVNAGVMSMGDAVAAFSAQFGRGKAGG